MHLTNATGQTVSLLNDERAAFGAASRGSVQVKRLDLGRLSLHSPTAVEKSHISWGATAVAHADGNEGRRGALSPNRELLLPPLPSPQQHRQHQQRHEQQEQPRHGEEQGEDSRGHPHRHQHQHQHHQQRQQHQHQPHTLPRGPAAAAAAASPVRGDGPGSGWVGGHGYGHGHGRSHSHNNSSRSGGSTSPSDGRYYGEANRSSRPDVVSARSGPLLPTSSSLLSSPTTTTTAAGGAGATAGAATTATATTTTTTTAAIIASTPIHPTSPSSTSSSHPHPPADRAASRHRLPAATALEPRLDHAAAVVAHPSATANLPTSRTLPSLARAASHRLALPIFPESPSSSSSPHAVRPRLHLQQAYTAADGRKASASSIASSASAASASTPPSDVAASPVASPGTGAAGIPAGAVAALCTKSPPLLRHDSGTSSARSLLGTPSPMTPTYGFDPLDQNKPQPPGMMGMNDPYSYQRHPGAYFAPGPPAPLPHGALLGHPAGLGGVSGGGPAPPAGAYYPLAGVSAPLGDDGFGLAPAGPVPGGPAPLGVVPFATDLIQPSPQFQPPPSATIPHPAGGSASPPNPHATPATGTGAASAGPNGPGTTQQKARKKYPCPHAARYGCTDTFTTSGHAARHGKKHTGEKNILCPTCHKAFTRKDNMKQHERTHRNHRDSVASAGSGGPPETGSNKRGKPNHASTSSIGHPSDAASTGSVPADVDADGMAAYDQHAALRGGGVATMDFGPVSTGNVFLDTDLEGGGPSPAADDPVFEPLHRKRPAGVERQVSSGSQDGEGESPGLDALAMAASGFS